MSQATPIDQVELGNIEALSAALLAAGVPEESLEQDDDDQPKDDKPTEPPAAAAPAASPPPAPAAGAPSGAATEDRPTGILMKDGKTVIPYGVLQGERDQRRAAEQRAQQLQAQLDEMSAQGATPAEKSAAAKALFTDEELADLADALPAVKVLHDELVSLRAQVSAGPAPAPRSQSDQDEAEDREAAAVSAAIATTPLLQRLSAKGGALWEEAKGIDRELLQDTAWADKPYAERFAEVQRRISEDYGIPIPSPGGSPSNTPAPPPAPKVHQVEEAREIETLSGMNGRAPVAEQDEAARLSSVELREKFDRMSGDQISAFLERAGG